MAIMTQRCTFALDEATTSRIRKLAAAWKVSQAEVIRRSVATAEAEPQGEDAAELLSRLHESGGGLSEAEAVSYVAEVNADRRRWRSAR